MSMGLFDNPPGAGKEASQEARPRMARPQAPPKPKEIVHAKWLDEIYDTYPRKVAPPKTKQEIERAIRIIRPRHETMFDAYKWMLDRTKLFATSPKGRGELKEACPHGTTFYHQGRYDDDPREWGSRVRERTENAPSTGSLADFMRHRMKMLTATDDEVEFEHFKRGFYDSVRVYGPAANESKIAYGVWQSKAVLMKVEILPLNEALDHARAEGLKSMFPTED